MSPFESPAELHPYVRETAQIMAALGMSAARGLEAVSAQAFTTSSEWLGELGASVRNVESSGDVPSDVQDRLDRIMRLVHEVWPKL